VRRVRSVSMGSMGVVVVGRVICVVVASASNWFFIVCLREYLMLLRLKRESVEDKRHQGHRGRKY